MKSTGIVIQVDASASPTPINVLEVLTSPQASLKPQMRIVLGITCDQD